MQSYEGNLFFDGGADGKNSKGISQGVGGLFVRQSIVLHYSKPSLLEQIHRHKVLKNENRN